MALFTLEISSSFLGHPQRKGKALQFFAKSLTLAAGECWNTIKVYCQPMHTGVTCLFSISRKEVWIAGFGENIPNLGSCPTSYATCSFEDSFVLYFHSKDVCLTLSVALNHPEMLDKYPQYHRLSEVKSGDERWHSWLALFPSMILPPLTKGRVIFCISSWD